MRALGWQHRSVKTKASALLAALTRRLDGRVWGAFFLLPAMQATAALLRSSSIRRQRKANQAPLQLNLFPLQQSIACCWDLICPEEAWQEQPLRWAV